MPTEADLNEYAKQLPDIYRDILSAFPEIEPGREAGYGLALQTIVAHFINTRRPYSFGDVHLACGKLVEQGLLEVKHGIFLHPTEVGERLIAAVTGKPVASAASRIPELPVRTW